MSLGYEDRKTLVDLYWAKVEQTLRDIEISIEGNAWSMAANRIYYACFYAVTALLVMDGHEVGTHLGAKITFGKYYVKAGLATPEEGRLFSQLASQREKADYDCMFTANENNVMQLYPEALALIEHISQLMNR